MKISTKFVLIIILNGFLIGCGSSENTSNNTTPAARINAANEVNLAIAAAEGVKQSVQINNGQTGFRQSNSQTSPNNFIQSLINSLDDNLALAPTPIPGVCLGGGTATIDTNTAGTLAVIVYDQCSDAGVISNGTLNVSIISAGTLTTLNYSTDIFTLTFAGEVTAFDLSASCTFDSNAPLEVNCTYSSSALGIDNRSYSISTAVVTGDETSGYTVSVSIVDPDHGSFSIATNSPVFFNCSDGKPSAGEIQFSDADGVLVTISFDSCTSFTVSYNGVSNTYNWLRQIE